MKALKLIPILILALSTMSFTPAPGGKDKDKTDGIDFFHGTLEEAQARARLEGKLVFVDAYASWCGPCRQMNKKVFNKGELGDFFNANFINVKINTEKGEGPTVSKKYQVRYLPTLLFVDADGNEVKRMVGYRSVAELMKEGKILAKKPEEGTTK